MKAMLETVMRRVPEHLSTCPAGISNSIDWLRYEHLSAPSRVDDIRSSFGSRMPLDKYDIASKIDIFANVECMRVVVRYQALL